MVQEIGKYTVITGASSGIGYEAATKTEFGMMANNVSEYDYDKSFETYHTSKQVAGFLLQLYDSKKAVGLVDRDSFSFRLAGPLFPYAGNKRVSCNEDRL